MTHDPRAAANWFINRGIAADHPLLHPEIQTLLYFAHGWMLGLHGTPLHRAAWEAWRYGPVLPEIYFNLNVYQGQPIGTPIRVPEADFSQRELTILNGVYDYRSLGVVTLIGITQDPNGPWSRVWHNRQQSKLIRNRDLQTYFAELHRQRSGARG